MMKKRHKQRLREVLGKDLTKALTKDAKREAALGRYFLETLEELCDKVEELADDVRCLENQRDEDLPQEPAE